MRQVCLTFFLFCPFFGLNAEGKTKVSVETFHSMPRRGSCLLNGWGNNLGTEFQREIANALIRSKKYEIIPNSSTDQEVHYSVLGAIRQFESCSFGSKEKEEQGRGFRRWVFGLKNGGLKDGYKKYSAKVLMDILIVDNETKEVVEIFSAKGKSSQTLADLKSAYDGSSFRDVSFVESPIGEATKNALKKSLRRILTALPEKRSSVLAQKSLSSEENQIQDEKQSPTSATAKKKKFVCRSTVSKSGFSPCRILGLDESNTKVQVMDEGINEKRALSSDSIYRLVPRNRVPKQGARLFVDLELSGLGNDTKKKYEICRYSDRVGTNFIVNCLGTEYVIDFRSAFYKQKVKIKLPKPEQLVSRQ